MRRDLVRDDQLTGEKRILVMINRSAITEPIARCKIALHMFSGAVEVQRITNPTCDVVIGNFPGIHIEVWGKVKTDRDEGNPCNVMTNEDLGPIKEKEVTCAVVTRAEAVRQERKISSLIKVSDVGNVNVTSDSFKIAEWEDPTLKVFFDKAKQTPSSGPRKNLYFMKGVCCIDDFRETNLRKSGHI